MLAESDRRAMRLQHSPVAVPVAVAMTPPPGATAGCGRGAGCRKQPEVIILGSCRTFTLFTSDPFAAILAEHGVDQFATG